MIESSNAAPSQPAPETAQTSDEKSGNMSAEQLVQFLAAKKPEAEVQVPEAQEEAAPEVSAEDNASEEAAETESKPEPEAEATEEAVEPENTEDSEEGEDDDVLSQKSALDPKTKDKIQKRIDKEVGKRKALEEEKTKLAAELEELKKRPEPEARVVYASEDNPLAHVDDEPTLRKEWEQAKQVKRWAEDILDSDDIDQGVKVGDRTVSKQEIKEILKNAKRTLEDQIPSRARFLQDRETARAQAYAAMPFLKDKNASEYQLVQKAYKDFPWLQRVPNGEYLVGLAIKGEKALAAEKAAAAKPAPKPAPKAPVSQVATAAAAPKPKTAESNKDREIDLQIKKLEAGKITPEAMAQILKLKSQKSRK